MTKEKTEDRSGMMEAGSKSNTAVIARTVSEANRTKQSRKKKGLLRPATAGLAMTVKKNESKSKEHRAWSEVQ